MRRKGEFQTQTHKLGQLAGRQEPAPRAVLTTLQTLRIKRRVINSARASPLHQPDAGTPGDQSVSRDWGPSFRFSLRFYLFAGVTLSKLFNFSGPLVG